MDTKVEVRLVMFMTSWFPFKYDLVYGGLYIFRK